MFSQLCPIFALVCSTFYFPELQIRLTLLGITFFMNTFTFCFLLSSLKLLAGRISGGLENTWSTTCIFNPLFPIFFNSLLCILLLAYHFSLKWYWKHFFRECLLGPCSSTHHCLFDGTAQKLWAGTCFPLGRSHYQAINDRNFC